MYIKLQWDDLNSSEEGHRIYRSTAPIDLENLPEPIAEVGADVTEFLDWVPGAEEEFLYYRVAAFRGEEFAVSEELMFWAGEPYDPYWDNVVSLLHFDGSLIDETGREWIFGGNYMLDESKGKFGGSSLKLTEGYLQSVDDVLGWSEGEFTFEIQVARDVGKKTYFFCYGTASSRKINTHNFENLWSNTGLPNALTGTVIPDDGQFHHLVISRALVGGNYRVLGFMDGTKYIDVPDTASTISAFKLYVGQTLVPAEGYAECWIDEFRITKGIARYTEDFDPPTAPFPNSGPEPTPPPNSLTI